MELSDNTRLTYRYEKVRALAAGIRCEAGIVSGKTASFAMLWLAGC